MASSIGSSPRTESVRMTAGDTELQSVQDRLNFQTPKLQRKSSSRNRQNQDNKIDTDPPPLQDATRSPTAASEGDQRTLTSPEEGSTAYGALPRADGGKDAWLVLAAAFILEGLVWGFPFAFGVFQEYYATDDRFSQDESSLAAVGTTQTGIMYLGAPFTYVFFHRFPAWRKPVSILGFVILSAALIAASFANTVPQLLATQGVMYAIGGLLNYFPVFLYIDEWWVSRKGFAYGVIWAGAGTAGVAMPLTLRWILTTWGFRTALRAWAVVNAALTIPALFWLKGRLPTSAASTGRRKLELGFLKSSTFWILQIGNIGQALGYFMPSLYITSFARSVGFSTLIGTLAISVMNTSNILGATVFGIVTDKLPVTTAINICAIGTVLSVFLFWSFAVYLPMLFLFAILYGTFSAGFAATWPGITDAVRQKYPATDTGMIIATMAAGKGIGSIVSGPISGALVRSDVWRNSAAYAFGSGYGYLILFSGLTAGFSLIGWCGKKAGLV